MRRGSSAATDPDGLADAGGPSEPDGTAERPASADAEHVRRLARLLDSAVRIPGTRIRFGLDSILGLIPAGGDVVGATLAAWIVLQAARLGAPFVVLVRMTGNLAVDALVGAIPVLGDLFDLGWRGNVRNVALLERHLEAPERTRRRSALALGGVAGGLLGVVGLLAWGAWVVVRSVMGWIWWPGL